MVGQAGQQPGVTLAPKAVAAAAAVAASLVLAGWGLEDIRVEKAANAAEGPEVTPVTGVLAGHAGVLAAPGVA